MRLLFRVREREHAAVSPEAATGLARLSGGTSSCHDSAFEKSECDSCRSLVTPIKVQQKVANVIDVVLCHPMVTAEQKTIRHNLHWHWIRYIARQLSPEQEYHRKHIGAVGTV